MKKIGPLSWLVFSACLDHLHTVFDIYSEYINFTLAFIQHIAKAKEKKKTKKKKKLLLKFEGKNVANTQSKTCSTL